MASVFKIKIELGRKGNMTKRQGKKQGNLEEEEKPSIVELHVSGQLKWSVKGRVLFCACRWAFFQAFSFVLFFCNGNYIAFCICKGFLHCVCLVCFENCFVFMIGHMIFFFFCFGIHFITWSKKHFIKNKIPKIFLKNIFRLFQTPCLSFVD